MTTKQRTLAAVALASAFGVSGFAWAQQGDTQQGAQTDPSGGAEPAAAKDKTQVASAAQVVSTTGTIQSVDRDKRTVVLKKASGDEVKVQVPPDMAAFDQIKKGQKVDLTYYDSIGVSVLPPGATAPSTETRTAVEPAQQGGVVGRETTVAAKVAKVDTKNNSVELKLANGQMQKVNISDPELQKKLADLKTGQTVTVTYTEAVAATLVPSGQH
jgi:hypothetical protein